MNANITTQALTLLEGAYDLHTHTVPSHMPRALDDMALLQEAAQYHMAGVMIKNHYEPTGARAALVNRLANFPDTKAYGGIVLNHPVGGLNPYAAESALKMGASLVWMPTRDAANCLLSGDMPGDFFQRPGISVLNAVDHLLPVVYDIMDIVKKYNACLATGHVSTKEALLLCKEGCARGVKMIFTHPEWDRTTACAQIQCTAADYGVKIEKNWYNIAEKNCTLAQMITNIRAVGCHRVFLATDRGQAGAEHPVEAMAFFIQCLLNNGFKSSEIREMTVHVPEALICD
ncbi:MAG: DUF6282 family protein [Candidatus Fimivivens sp.]